VISPEERSIRAFYRPISEKLDAGTTNSLKVAKSGLSLGKDYVKVS